MLQILCYNFVMIKIADRPWQIMLHAKTFRHSKIYGKKRFKRIKKNQKLTSFGKFVCEMLIFRSNRSQIIFKILFSKQVFQKQPPEMLCKKGLLINFTEFTGKNRCQGLFLNKVADLRPATILRKRLWHRCFPMNFAKFVRTPFIIERLWWLLLVFL